MELRFEPKQSHSRRACCVLLHTVAFCRPLGRDLTRIAGPFLALTPTPCCTFPQAHRINSSQATFSSHTQCIFEQEPREEQTQTIPFTPALMLRTPPFPALFSLAMKTLFSTNFPLPCKSANVFILFKPCVAKSLQGLYTKMLTSS